MRKATRYSLLLTLACRRARRRCHPPQGGAPRSRPPAPRVRRHRLRQSQPLRAATHFDQNPVPRTPDYQHFIDATGIVPERDLDSAAFALHRMADPPAPTAPSPSPRSSKAASTAPASPATSPPSPPRRSTTPATPSTPSPSEGSRHLRVAQLGYDTIAASNMPTPEQIHSMLDRHRAAASPLRRLLPARRPLSRSPAALERLGHRPHRPALLRSAAASPSSACSCRCRKTPPSSPASATRRPPPPHRADRPHRRRRRTIRRNAHPPAQPPAQHRSHTRQTPARRRPPPVPRLRQDRAAPRPRHPHRHHPRRAHPPARHSNP